MPGIQIPRHLQSLIESGTLDDPIVVDAPTIKDGKPGEYEVPTESAQRLVQTSYVAKLYHCITIFFAYVDDIEW